MYRIAILGCENSHADAFLDLIINQKKYPDIEVVGVYSNESEALERMKDKFGVYCASNFDEFVGKVDGIMITARDGRNHYKYAAPYIASGIPMFIDKPITSDEDEALAFMRELKSHGCKVTGGSSCPHAPYVKELAAKVAATSPEDIYGGYLRAPVSMQNNYGNFFFYAQHLAEVLQSIFGYYPKSVLAHKNANVITLTVKYDSYDVSAEYVDGNYVYYASVSTKDGIVGDAYTIDGSLYYHELDAFDALLHGAAQPCSYRQLIAPVYLICAIARAIESGEEESLAEIGEI